MVQVIERPDMVAVVEETFANVRADEARAAGDEKIHGQTLTISEQSVERAGGGNICWNDQFPPFCPPFTIIQHFRICDSFQTRHIKRMNRMVGFVSAVLYCLFASLR